jgi:hypothetical protein
MEMAVPERREFIRLLVERIEKENEQIERTRRQARG